MIDGRAFAVPVLFEGGVHLWGRVGIVQRSVLVAAIGEGTRDTDGADGIEPIGILHDEAFERVHFVFDPCTFEGDMLDDLADSVSGGDVQVAGFKPRPGAKRGCVRRVVELPIVQVMEQGGELHDEGVRPLRVVLADGDGILPHAINMPPIVTGRIVREFLLYILDRFLDDLLLGHEAYFATNGDELVTGTPILCNLPHPGSSCLKL